MADAMGVAPRKEGPTGWTATENQGAEAGGGTGFLFELMCSSPPCLSNRKAVQIAQAGLT